MGRSAQWVGEGRCLPSGGGAGAGGPEAGRSLRETEKPQGVPRVTGEAGERTAGDEFQGEQVGSGKFPQDPTWILPSAGCKVTPASHALLVLLCICCRVQCFTHINSDAHDDLICVWAHSVPQWCPTLSRPPGLQPTGLSRPWTFPGKNTGVGCHYSSSSSSRGSTQPKDRTCIS